LVDAGAGLESSGGRSVSFSSRSLADALRLEELEEEEALADAFDRALPNANQASKNAATPVSAGAMSCELSSTIRLP